ncbi:hypothetical protein [Methylovulum sp.]|uniref:hypothetical protein n=1 Tax=Methylovulum sp. TaxID=1916980 RepID=UPI0026039616|nr:hypothetical protein [Methylovulum sp.]
MATCINANEGSPHSWYVLESPEGFVAGTDGSYTGAGSKIFICLYLTSNVYSVYFRFSLIGFTGGTDLATPSAVDKIEGVASLISTNHVFSFAAASDGSFSLRSSYASSGKIIACLEVRKLYDLLVKTSDGNDYPYGVWISSYSNGYNQSVSLIMGSSQNRGWSKNGTPVNCYLLTPMGTTGAIGAGTGTFGDNVNSLNEAGEVIVYIADPAYPGRIGRVPDYYITGATIPTGTLDSLLATKFMINGNVWVVADAVLSI